MRTDISSMVRLGENLPHRGEHLFSLQTNAKSVLSAEIRVRKEAQINSGIALIPATRTSIGQLEEYRLRIAQTFGACRVERNEKWATY